MQHPIGVCRLTGRALKPDHLGWPMAQALSRDQRNWLGSQICIFSQQPDEDYLLARYLSWKKRGNIQSTPKALHSKERQREISKAQNKKHHTFGTLRKCPTKMIWNIQSQSVLHISSWGHSLSRDNIISTCSFGEGGHQQVLNGGRLRKFVILFYW